MVTGPQWDKDNSIWDEDDMVGFISILRAGSDPKMRVRAIQELKTIQDMRAVHAIAMAAVWSDVEEISIEAHKAIQELFGEDAGAALAAYREHGMLIAEEDDDAGEMNEIRVDEDDLRDRVSFPTAQNLAVEPVVQEEKVGLGSEIIIGLIVLAFILYMLIRS